MAFIAFLEEMLRKKDLGARWNLTVHMTFREESASVLKEHQLGPEEAKEIKRLFRSYWGTSFHVTRDGTILPTYQSNIPHRTGFIALDQETAKKRIRTISSGKKK